MDGLVSFDAGKDSKESRNQDDKISHSNGKLGIGHTGSKYHKNNIENRSSQGVEDSGKAEWGIDPIFKK